MRFSILIPTYNGLRYIRPLFESLASQDARPEEIVVVDSSSKDGTLEAVQGYAGKFNLMTRTIPGREFNHGGTRNLSAGMASGEILVFMSQDIVLQGNRCLSSLLGGYREPAIASVYGKQVPYPDHSPVNRYLRHYNYPEREIVRDKANAHQYGIKAYFNSNSFSSYRKDAFEKLGGFDPDIIFGEDTVFTKKLIDSGYKVMYTPDAAVMHSHDYSILETFRRYFDLGVCHKAIFGDGTGAKNRSGGAGYFGSQLRWLAANGHGAQIPVACMDLVVKGVGYKLGYHHRLVPGGLKGKISMNKAYWSGREAK